MKALVTNKTLYGHVFAFVLIIVTGLIIQKGYMNEYPTHIHAWAEQDHYALALGFINNGFDFFHPETMIYNKQFPGWWKEAYDNTITSVDFPIHEYTVALLMKLLGSTSPWVFRFWTLFWGFLGLFFLFKVAYRLTVDWMKSALVTAIALTSPVYTYFLNGFLPSIPALSLGIIGLWFYLKYYDCNQRKHFHLGIAFLTLAMLMRTTFAIELIAILCFELLRILRKESTFIDKLPSVLISALLFVAYFLWNKHLRDLYGTLFLNELLPPENWQDAKELVADTYKKWTYHYFQRLQYLVFYSLALLAIVVSLYRSTKNEEKNAVSIKKPLSLWWLPIIEIFGCLLFSVAMMQQLPFHDYYLLDTFFLPILLLVILTLNALPKAREANQIGWCAFLTGVVCTLMVINAKTTQVERWEMENDALVSYEHFQGADLLLDSLDIPRDAKILCLYGYAQNGPFIQMQRKGYTVMTNDNDLLETALTWDFDYIIIENGKYMANFEEKRIPLSKLKRIGGNKHLNVCTADNDWIYQEWWQLIYH